MTIEEKITALLQAAAGVTALVPTTRIGVLSLSQATARPYIRHSPVSLETTHVHNTGAMVAMRRWDFYQVDVIADSYASCRAVADAVVTALDGYHGASVQTVDYRGMRYLFETGVDPPVYHIALDFEIAESL